MGNGVASMARLWIVSPRCINMRKWAGRTIYVNGFMIYQTNYHQEGTGGVQDSNCCMVPNLVDSIAVSVFAFVD